MISTSVEQPVCSEWTLHALVYRLEIATIFAAILVLLLIVGTVSYTSTVRLIDSGGWVTHTRTVILEAEEMLADVFGAETGQRGYLLTGEDRYLRPYLGVQQSVDERLGRLLKLTADNPRQQQRLQSLAQAIHQRFAGMQEVIDIRRSKGFDAALRLVLTDKGREDMETLRRTLKEATDEEYGLLSARSYEEQQLARRTESTIIIGTLGAFLLMVIAGFYLWRSLAGPVGEISTAAQALALGDVTVDVPLLAKRHDEVGVLAHSFVHLRDSLRRLAENQEKIATGDLIVDFQPRSDRDVLAKAFLTMRDQLRRIIEETRDSVNVLSSSAQQIVATTTQVASSAVETAAAVTQTTTTVEEVKQTAQLSAQKAKLVSDNAQKAAQVSQTGKKSAEESIEGMKRIREQMESIAESIVRLSEQGQSIGEIVLTVNDLAEQSNLLAVNASIEAAKAGEYGRGFAVVAQEVRSLAEQSKQASAQIRRSWQTSRRPPRPPSWLPNRAARLRKPACSSLSWRERRCRSLQRASAKQRMLRPRSPHPASSRWSVWTRWPPLWRTSRLRALKMSPAPVRPKQQPETFRTLGINSNRLWAGTRSDPYGPTIRHPETTARYV